MITSLQPQAAPLTRMDPTRLVDSARNIWDEGYVAGYVAGVALEQARGGYDTGRRDGWVAHVEQEQLSWQTMARFVREAGSPRAVTFEQLRHLRTRLPEDYKPGPHTFDQCTGSWGLAAAIEDARYNAATYARTYKWLVW